MKSFHFDVKPISITAGGKKRDFATDNLNDRCILLFLVMNVNDLSGTITTFTNTTTYESDYVV